MKGGTELKRGVMVRNDVEVAAYHGLIGVAVVRNGASLGVATIDVVVVVLLLAPGQNWQSMWL